MKIVKRTILRILIYFRIFPHIFLVSNPFKIYEFEELQRRIKFSRNDLILDIGCGSGLKTLLLGKKCKKVIGIDISKKAIASAKIKSTFLNRRINSEFRCVKLENAEFEDEYFDKIFSICVIEHISNYEQLLKESYRILKRNGHMIFSVDALETIEDNKLVEKHRREHHVKKYFKIDELKIILQEAEFKRISIYPIFKSDFAKKIFIKGINNKFQYGYIRTLLFHAFLNYKEHKCTSGNGIFLIVKCCK
jgi:2-polyprenyl-3-methyl-5-hydroxy-6-metoxy-1,4-benzoquinol methylase